MAGDDALGYQDLGEEDDWHGEAAARRAAEEGPKAKAPREGPASKKRKAAGDEVAKRKDARLQKLFAEATAKSKQQKAAERAPAQPAAAAAAAAAAPGGDDGLDDILADLEDDDGPGGAPVAPPPRVRPAPARDPFARGPPRPAPAFRAPAPRPVSPPPKRVAFAPAARDADPVEEDLPEMDLDLPAAPAAGPATEAAEPARAEDGAAETAARLQANLLEQPKAPPAPQAPKEEDEAGGPDHWQLMCDAAEAELAAAPADAATEVWANDGSLPLEGDALPLYLMDVHEERGTAYLTGRVAVGQGRTLSCCAVVDNLVRNLFFVPAATLVERGPELDRLEGDLEANREGAKLELMKYFHQKFAPLKAEVRQLLANHRIENFSMVPVQRNYGFENKAVARARQWVLKVKYFAKDPALSDLERGEHFKAVFGVRTSPLETLILKRKLKGPQWVLLSKPRRVETQSQVSWCKMEVTVESPKQVLSAPGLGNRPPPKITVAAVNLKTFINPKHSTSEIVAATVMHVRDVRTDVPTESKDWNNLSRIRYFSVVRKLEGESFPIGFEAEVKKKNASPLGKLNDGAVLSQASTERALLCNFLARLDKLDPDVLVGHNFAGFDADVLLRRLEKLKVPKWSRIGRIKRSRMPNLKSSQGGGMSFGAMTATAGRLIGDTYISARELLREVDYSLASLAKTQLGETLASNHPEVVSCFNSKESLLGLVDLAEKQAHMSLGLLFHLNTLPLSSQLAGVSGFLWNKVLLGGRAQRIEYLLLHEFHRRKFIVPDKTYGRKDGNKKKGPSYAGGLVLDPKKGLYDELILLLDFNSLYPSIIQEYNICFTTVERPEDGNLPPLPPPSQQMAPLPTVIKGLVDRRKAVKGMLKKEKATVKRQQLDLRQMALKLTANSMYGCLGFSHSRFYAQPLAELITFQGREILQNTKDLAESTLGLDVVYGDTDSIMINSKKKRADEAVAMGQKVKFEVNKRYKRLEIDIDGLFKRMLLLKKKKYAAIKLEPGPDGKWTEESMEQKGLDIVRRDWCGLAKDMGNFALERILSGDEADAVSEAIHGRLSSLREEMEKGSIPLGRYVLTKQLTKNPQDYADAKGQAHVQVALRNQAKGKKNGVSMGQTVQYFICVDSAKDAGGGLADRAYSIEEYKERKDAPEDEGRLAIDLEYYLSQQVHPVVSRLCEPLDGTDSARIADCLGLDTAKYHAKSSRSAGLYQDPALASGSLFEDEESYRDCEQMKLKFDTGALKEFAGVKALLKAGADVVGELKPPGAPNARALTPAQIANQVALQAHEHVTRYYDCQIRATEDVGLFPDTRDVSLYHDGETPLGSLGPDPCGAARAPAAVEPVYTDAALYLQLLKYQRVLSVDNELARADPEQQPPLIHQLEVKKHLDEAARTAEAIKQKSAYRYVDLGSIWTALVPGLVA